MKNKKQMDIVFLLDRSGSMRGLEEVLIGGYNSYINTQKNNNVKVTTILFDDKYEMLENRLPINEVKELDNKKYFVRGTTALLDAIGKTINFMDEQKPKKVIFIITTDGLENASKTFTKAQIKELIEGHSNWEFIYIGAGIDSYKEGGSIGINSENISNYSKNKEGVSNLFKAIGNVSKTYYMEDKIKENWKDDLEK